MKRQIHRDYVDVRVEALERQIDMNRTSKLVFLSLIAAYAALVGAWFHAM